MSKEQHVALNAALRKSGLELMDDKNGALVEKIRIAIIEMVHYTDEPLPASFSRALSSKLFHDYHYLANLFSEVEGITIEKFVIIHKIDRVKELLKYDKLSLTKISYLMNYSSVAHLSTQFKKITGLTPTQFKELVEKSNIMPADVGMM
jgi:AraC-like DNA-binding protein